MSADFDSFSEDDELWLSDLETRAIDLEQELSVWREVRQRALAEDDYDPERRPPLRRTSHSAGPRAGPTVLRKRARGRPSTPQPGGPRAGASRARPAGRALTRSAPGRSSTTAAAACAGGSPAAGTSS